MVTVTEDRVVSVCDRGPGWCLSVTEDRLSAPVRCSGPARGWLAHIPGRRASAKAAAAGVARSRGAVRTGIKAPAPIAASALASPVTVRRDTHQTLPAMKLVSTVPAAPVHPAESPQQLTTNTEQRPPRVIRYSQTHRRIVWHKKAL